MSIFRDFFNVKQKPVFTGSRFGFGSGGAGDTGSAPPGFSASGGNAEYTLNGYKYHVFTSSGSLVVDSGVASDEVEFLIIGGGGGAGAGASVDFGRGGGGGGAGGVRCSFQGLTPGGPGASPESGITCTAGTTYPVTVGDGGAGFTSGTGGSPNNGGDSSFGPPSSPERVFAGGGARGVGSRNNNGADSGGGSAGGASASEDNNLAGGGAQTTGQGVNPSVVGGYPGGGTEPESNICGGGGGAGGAGQVAADGNESKFGKGGAGMPFPTAVIPTSYGQASPSGPGRWFAQGGYGESADSGGSCTYVNEGGGGTNPHNASANTAGDGKNGVANTGSGAGGMGDNETGGNGGSGIVFLRYRV